MAKKSKPVGENVISPAEVQALRNQLQKAHENAEVLQAKLRALEIVRKDQVDDLFGKLCDAYSDIAELLTRCAQTEAERVAFTRRYKVSVDIDED